MKIRKSKMKVAFLLTLLLATFAFSQITLNTQFSLSENQLVSSVELSQTYTDHPAIAIDGNADFLSQATSEIWEGTGAAENPIVIEGYRITDSINIAIQIQNVDLHWIIRDCLIDGNPPYACGFDLQNSSNGEFSNNILQNRDVGIQCLEDVYNCSFLNNQVLNNQDTAFKVISGLGNCIISGNNFSGNAGNNFWMTGGFNDSLFTDNTITGGANGIRCLAFLRSVVSGNTISDCTLDALVFPSAYGVVIRDNTVTNTTGCGIMTSGNDAVIEGNTVIDSTLSGIYLAFGENGTIHHNTVTDSSEYGVKLGGATSNTSVSENSFIDNVGVGSQILDDGENNLITYNHYSDWISPDGDLNGIVDVAYSLDGEASNSDPFPIVDVSGIIPTTPTADALPIDPVLIAGIGVGVVALIVVIVLVKRR
ncbi:hypothetical protein EU528_04330 [Candidatus Thorarchaeota archaeon]|nr:MAG: hypothetical protein EU528_04330 [Candidatus Thorarchaeota archaeon]